MPSGRTKVWVDVTNSPDVLFFLPILRRFSSAGVEWVVTARDYAQTVGLLELHSVPHTVIGHHGGASIAGKAFGLARRSAQLTRYGRGTGAGQAVSLGSNDLSVAARLLRLHNTVIQDYEGATIEHRVNFRLADKVMFPSVVPFAALERLGLDRRRYRPFDGIKEQVTLADFVPDLTVPGQLKLDPDRPYAVLRPPATMSLYQRGVHNTSFDAALAYLQSIDAPIVLLPRTHDQARRYAGSRNVTIPAVPVDGLSLVYAAAAVISAGGSLNREAAMLGVPTWTTFAGKLPAVDVMLVEAGQMQVLERPEQIVLARRTPTAIQVESIADAVTDEILRR